VFSKDSNLEGVRPFGLPGTELAKSKEVLGAR